MSDRQKCLTDTTALQLVMKWKRAQRQRLDNDDEDDDETMEIEGKTGRAIDDP
jgi:hypothetical protein